VKLRSMRILADTSGVMSTAGNDPRITAIGRFVRRWKRDEMTQLWNVLCGDMSLVGPRPQVLPDVARYTPQELEMLTVRPGITDLASIVFADEGRSCEAPPIRTCGTTS
jgi:lipopolysaccharide/colanic/teichoic acid biosynthesis glycosyltransferase